MATSQTTKKNNNFLIQGSILAVAGIIVRLIGLAYRIPLIRIIGDEGMGYYSVAYEIYSVVLLLSSYSLPLAVSKMISARIAREEYGNAHRILKVALIYATVVGFVGCAFVGFTAEWFANVFYMLPLSKYALLSLAPTIWIMAYLGVMRGYYQGQSTMVPTAVSQILEQIVNAIVSVGAAWWLCNTALNAAKGKSAASAYGAAGGTIGTGAGALTALVVLIIMFWHGKKEWMQSVDDSIKAGTKIEDYKTISRVLVWTVVPVILSSAVYNIIGIIDAEIFSTTMVSRFGLDPSRVASDYGAYTGKFKTLVNIPVAIANSLSSSLIPVMARAAAENNEQGVHDGITKALRFTVLIALPASVGLTILGGPVISLLFGRSDLASMMATIGSFGVLFYSVSTVSNAILQGNNYMRIPVFNAVISLVIHMITLLILLRVFRLGIYAVIISYLLYGFTMVIFNAIAIKNKLHYRQEWKQTVVLPLICSFAMGAVTIGIQFIIRRFISDSNIIIVGVCVVIAILVYVAMIIVTGCISREELKSFPVIKKFVS